MKPQLVLSDDLLLLYLEARTKILGQKDHGKLLQLLSFYKSHLTNEAQYTRIGKTLSSELNASLLKSGISPNLSLEELAQKTTLKIILDKEKKEYPYVSIDGSDKLQSCYVGNFWREPREKCIAHLKALCKNATSIFVYDKYLYAENRSINDNERLLSNILRLMDRSRNQTLSIYDTKKSIKDEVGRIVQKCKKEFPNITVRVISSEDFAEKHDRYMVIKSTTGNVEILLSSGFDNLFEDSKDFTYLIRPI